MAAVKEVAGFKLYYQGEWADELFAKCTAVVGSRWMTTYGQRVVEQLIPKLVQNGQTIVSGFMYGVDQEAHRQTVACGGKTIAVLGWGIDWPLESSDLQLAESIINSGGLLVSLWQTQQPTLWTFPARNKVVATLAQDIIVVEAGLKSGSLITADMGLKLKKNIWAVPGPITSSVSAGTNQLIADGKAKMYTHLSSSPSPKLRRGEGGEVNPILVLIENESLDTSDIARKLNRSVESVGSELTMLALQGLVEERMGKWNRV